MEFRTYDPAIGRFNGIDPVTHFSQGTSVAFDNNPVFLGSLQRIKTKQAFFFIKEGLF